MNETELNTIKARQKATWESGDFGKVAVYVAPSAEEFMARLSLKPKMRVLDVACGTGNLAVIAARKGCETTGVDIASNLIAQAKARATAEGLKIDFKEGDAEKLPFADAQFDAVVTMYGAMFAPRPDVVASELLRVTKPGGFIAMANWTPEGFIGKMFEVFKKHLPPPPVPIPSTMLWGNEPAVRERLRGFSKVDLKRHIAVMRLPYSPADTVDFFRRYYGPTGKAFDSLGADAREGLRRDLVELQATHNASVTQDVTETHAEYMEVIAVR